MNDENKIRRHEPERPRGGTWVRFGDEEYRVPALGFRAIQDLQDRVEALRGLERGARPSPEQMDTVVTIVHSALLRNYPSMEKQQVEDMLGLDNFLAVLNAVLGVSGFVRGEASGGSGEAAASTGTASTSP